MSAVGIEQHPARVADQAAGESALRQNPRAESKFQQLRCWAYDTHVFLKSIKNIYINLFKSMLI